MNEHNFAKFYINLLFNKILFQIIVDHFAVFSSDGDCIAHCCPFSNQSKQQQQKQYTVWLKLVVLFFVPHDSSHAEFYGILCSSQMYSHSAFWVLL